MINLNNYIIVEESPRFTLSIKLVIPGGCQMRCPFCFNNLNRATAVRDDKDFVNNYMDSLKKIINVSLKSNPARPISLDITGNEPTFNKQLFIRIMKDISTIKRYFRQVVVTTNGEGLTEDTVDAMRGVVDIVNVSVHHYDMEKRAEAFGLNVNGKHVHPDSFYEAIIGRLAYAGIKATAVAVIYKKLDEPFNGYMNKFVHWCMSIGFDDLRLRSNFYSTDSFFIEYMNSMPEVPVVTSGLASKRFEWDGFNVVMLMGVTSLIPYVVGVEAVVDDDGLAYMDYGKEHPFCDEYIKRVCVKFP